MTLRDDMTLELVICNLCGFKFRTDIEAQINDGTTITVRGFFNFYKPKPGVVKSIDLLCPNCKKTFEYKVES
jgi:protein-arginine kinase activator protein McsA